MKTGIWHPLALVALAVSLGAVAGPVVWRLSGEPATPGVRPQTAQRQDASTQPARPNIAGLLTANPFGAATAHDMPVVPAGESTMGFTLLGVMLAIPAENSRAMIADASSVSQSHAVGAEIASGVTLVEINADHVLLSANGTLQTLSFPNALASSVASSGDVAALPATSGVAALNQLAPAEARYFIADPVEATDADSVIARYRAAIRQNPVSVMVRLGIEVTDRGYRVADATSQGVLNAGFLPGDIIRTVNGKPVGKLQSDVDLFDEVAAAGLAQVELLRGGEEIKLSFPLR